MGGKAWPAVANAQAHASAGQVKVRTFNAGSR
jgi:hypothetical protein